MLELYAHINGVDYPISLGGTETDNLGEELNSMEIVIPHAPKIEMKPYDEIVIHDYAPNLNVDGTFLSSNLPLRRYGQVFDPWWKPGKSPLVIGERKHFYERMAIKDYDRPQVDNVGERYNYSVSLWSETKLLEKCLAPNRTITNPLNKPGRKVSWMARHFVNRYTDRIKIGKRSGSTIVWEYKPHFIVSGFEEEEELRISNANTAHKLGWYTIAERFGNIRCFETSFNNPNLRELLTKIFQSSNCIPIVRDGVIFAIDLKKRGKKFDEIPGKTWDTESMNGDSYCDRLRKNYSAALTGVGGTKFHEFVGFRNINAATMKLEKLTIETKYPIYRINKFAICYYSNKENGKIAKFDLTSFVLPSTTRALLSNDYLYFNEFPPTTANGYEGVDGTYHLGLCDYRFMTVEYQIGGKEISGFGDFVKYTENGITNNKKCTLENVFLTKLASFVGNEKFESAIKPIDSTSDAQIMSANSKIEIDASDVIAPEPNEEWLSIVTALSSEYLFGKNGYIGKDILKLKNIFFEIEYQAQISSAVTVAKDDHDGAVVSVDSQQESLAVTEQDGEVSKAKVNRLGNKTRTIMARVPYGKGNWDSNLIAINQWNEEYGICYKRTIGLNRDFIAVTYCFCKDYVLMNYFTSVFSKYRSSAYASISDSVAREENQYFSLLISKDTQIRCDNHQRNGGDDKGRLESGEYVYGYDFNLLYSRLIGLFNGSDDNNKTIGIYSLYAPKQDLYFFDEADASQIEYQYFVSDRAEYLSGNSLCFSFGMSDSITAGTYIRQMYPDLSSITLKALSLSGGHATKDISSYGQYITYDSPITEVTGTMQNYLSLPLSKSDGSVEGIKFSLFDNTQNVQGADYGEGNASNSDSFIMSKFKDDLYKLPKLSASIAESPLLEYGVNIYEDYKDSKEVISETIQIDAISDSEDTTMSSYFMKMSNMPSKMIDKVLKKYEKDTSSENYPLLVWSEQWYAHSAYFGSGNKDDAFVHSFGIYTKIDDFSLHELNGLVGKTLNKAITFNWNGRASRNHPNAAPMQVTINKIKSIGPKGSYIVVNMDFRSYWGETDVSQGVYHKYLFGYEAVATNIDVIWWDADFLETPNGKSYINQELTIEGIDSYYPPKYDEPSLGTNDYVYNEIYSKGNDVASDGAKAHFISTPNRKCFVFNMASFPNGKTTLKVTDEISNKIVTYENARSDYFFADNQYDIGLVLQGMAVSNDCGAFDNVPIVSGYPDKNGMQRQMRLDIPPVETIWNNVHWLLTKFTLDNSFDSNVSFEEAEIRQMLDSGFLVELEYGKTISSTIDNDDGTMSIVALLPSSGQRKVEDYQSLVCLAQDKDELYHFVFGTNTEGTYKATIDGVEYDATKQSFYLSLVPDRSRTVFMGDTMEPSHRTANYANGRELADNKINSSSFNGAVPRANFGKSKA